MFYLVVGNGRLALWVPIYYPVAPIDKSGVVHSFKSDLHGMAALVVHSERFAAPIQRGPHLAKLLLDRASAVGNKILNFFYKRLSADIVAVFTLFFNENFFYFCVCRDRGMVCAGDP